MNIQRIFLQKGKDVNQTCKVIKLVVIIFFIYEIDFK